jgi:hypothetical protein
MMLRAYTLPDYEASARDPADLNEFIEAGERFTAEVLMVAHGELSATEIDRRLANRWGKLAAKQVRELGPEARLRFVVLRRTASLDRTSSHRDAVIDFAGSVERALRDLCEPGDWLDEAINRAVAGAPVVARCVERFVEDEIEPAQRPIGRHWTVPMPPIPTLLGIGPSAPSATVDGLRTALVKTLAIGYAGGILLETAPDSPARACRDRSAEVIWQWWVPRIGRFTAEEVIAKEPLERFRAVAKGELKDQLKSLGLKPVFRRRYRFVVTTYMYVEAGMLLRLPQTDFIADEFFDQDDFRAVAAHWPLHGTTRPLHLGGSAWSPP